MQAFFKNLNIFSPIFLSLLFLMVTFCLCSGCDNKQIVKIGDNAPEISGDDIHGEHVSLAHCNGKLVVICFWTNSCCADCVKRLEPFYVKYKNSGIDILAINEMDSKKDVEAFAKNNALTFTMLMDNNSMLLKQYHAVGFPTIFILDKHRIVREKVIGDISIEKLQKLVEKQLTIQKTIEADYEKNHPATIN